MVLYSYEEPLVPIHIYIYIYRERERESEKERELSQFSLQFQESERQFWFCKSDLVLVCILLIKPELAVLAECWMGMFGLHGYQPRAYP
jgi:hypothetical protein